MPSNDNTSHEKKLNWYPGHMLKAKKQLMEQLKWVDVVIEVRDARIPLACINQDFEQMLQNKPRLIILNKSDLANPVVSEEWKNYFQAQQQTLLLMNTVDHQGIKAILPLCKEFVRVKWEKYRHKGIRPPALRLMVVGVPNVGKSSLINRLVKRKATQTGPRPGVTRQQEWVRIGKEVELLDTPGILWPKISDQQVAYRLALTEAIKDKISGEQELAEYLLNYLKENHPMSLQESYAMNLEMSSTDIIGTLALEKHLLQSQAKPDMKRGAQLILKEFREGKLGKISLESPPD